MKFTLQKTIDEEVEITTLLVKAGVRYWEDSKINGEYAKEDGNIVPCKIGNYWRPMIDVEKGLIVNWEIGKTADIHFKVCDEFAAKLVNPNGEVILSVEDAYVPKCLCPKEDGYGDYIIMDIDENGYIQNWKFGISDLKELMIEILGE
jgi:hypothetical protein